MESLAKALARGTGRSQIWETLLQSTGQDLVTKQQNIILIPRLGGCDCLHWEKPWQEAHGKKGKLMWEDFLPISNNKFCSDPSLISISGINHSRDISGVWVHLVGKAAMLHS